MIVPFTDFESYFSEKEISFPTPEKSRHGSSAATEGC
jgi:hypothetical protein